MNMNEDKDESKTKRKKKEKEEFTMLLVQCILMSISSNSRAELSKRIAEKRSFIILETYTPNKQTKKPNKIPKRTESRGKGGRESNPKTK